MAPGAPYLMAKQSVPVLPGWQQETGQSRPKKVEFQLLNVPPLNPHQEEQPPPQKEQAYQ